MPWIRPLRGIKPQIHPKAWLAENATIIGDVEIGEESSIWYQVVIRGDVNRIQIGKQTNIQDGTIIHATYQTYPTRIGDEVTVGHLCLLHGCSIGRGSLIGMGSIIMDGAEIGDYCLVGAGSLVTEGKKFPSGQLIMGRPAVVKRCLRPDEIDALKESAQNYRLYSNWYQDHQ